VWVAWIDEAEWLHHVDFFEQEAMEKYIINIYLFERPTCRVGNR
jgi:hypothetical protein